MDDRERVESLVVHWYRTNDAWESQLREDGNVVGRLERVHLREVWKHEALDFTTWLENNTDVLTDAIGIEFTSVQREQAAGSFSVDLVAEDEDGDFAVIENQLERSDHDHLGKLITYLTAFEAKRAIWIVSDPRPEHVTAITWLNQSTPASFYLFKVEAVRIGESLPAPLLTLIVGPSDEGRAVGERKQELVEQHQEMQRFWSGLIERARSRTPLHANATPGRGTWLSAEYGKSGLFLSYIVRAHDARVELSIDTGDAEKNRRIFDSLEESREVINDSVGEPLIWDKREGRQICKVELPVSGGGYRDIVRRDEVYEAMIAAMVRLESSLRPYITRLDMEG